MKNVAKAINSISRGSLCFLKKRRTTATGRRGIAKLNTNNNAATTKNMPSGW